MFKFFKRKTKDAVSTETSVQADISTQVDVSAQTNDSTPFNRFISSNSFNSSSQEKFIPNQKMARLMELIGCAIDDWTIEFHLENLPKEIVFEQVLDAMRAIEYTLNSQKQ